MVDQSFKDFVLDQRFSDFDILAGNWVLEIFTRFIVLFKGLSLVAKAVLVYHRFEHRLQIDDALQVLWTGLEYPVIYWIDFSEFFNLLKFDFFGFQKFNQFFGSILLSLILAHF